MPIYRDIHHPIEPGTDIGGYRVVGEPLRGGFASVYRSVSTGDGRVVAVKVLDNIHVGGRRSLERFAREVEALRRIGHPNIVEVLGRGTLDDGRPYYVMEWLEGHTLEAELCARGPLAPVEALAIAEEICAALAAAHSAGVVHRDLKPDNIMVLPRGGRLSVKLVDFGIAKFIGGDSAGLTTTGVSLGTVHYMAPEQLLCLAIDARTDIYALGALLFRMVTGEVPFDGPGRMAVQMMHLDVQPPRASSRVAGAAPWDAVIQRCLSKDPDERPRSVAQVCESLRAAVTGRERAPLASRRAWLQLEFAGEIRARQEWNARTAAMSRASAWIRAAGWNLVLETDNALIGQARLDRRPGAGAIAPPLLDGAHRCIELFALRRIPWVDLAAPSRVTRSPGAPRPPTVVRGWIWSADGACPPDTTALDVPSGLYVEQTLVGKSCRRRARFVPAAPGFVFLQR